MKKLKKIPEDIKEELKFKYIKKNGWIIETTAARAYYVGEDGDYGDPYTSMLQMYFLDGKAYINSFVGVEFTRKCFRTIVGYVREHRGIKDVIYKRMKNRIDKFKKVKTD